jgi:hypothetical protein
MPDESIPDRAKRLLTTKYGPLPGWAWLAIGVGGIYIYRQMSGTGKAQETPEEIIAGEAGAIGGGGGAEPPPTPEPEPEPIPLPKPKPRPTVHTHPHKHGPGGKHRKCRSHRHKHFGASQHHKGGKKLLTCAPPKAQPKIGAPGIQTNGNGSGVQGIRPLIAPAPRTIRPYSNPERTTLPRAPSRLSL